MSRFRDRRSAGRLLGEHLATTGRYGPGCVVLGLPRGGVAVAAGVVEVLDADLDVIVVRKLGSPMNPEFAMGAIGSGGAMVLDEDTIRSLGITERQIADVVARERDELERREALYRAERPVVPVAGRDVIVVDDGIATGSTMRVAIDTLAARKPTTITVAVPVAPPDTLASFARRADFVEALAAPQPFFAVGAWYDDFGQTTDAEVTELLAAS